MTLTGQVMRFSFAFWRLRRRYSRTESQDHACPPGLLRWGMQKLTVTHLVVSLACLLAAAAASAQDAIVTTAAPIFVLPDSNRSPLRTAAANTRLEVLEEKPEGWVRVEFQDPQFGKRVGFIEARFVKILRAELEPMDLSVGREPARAPAVPEIARPPGSECHSARQSAKTVRQGVDRRQPGLRGRG